jgi:hypothetical protein
MGTMKERERAWRRSVGCVVIPPDVSGIHPRHEYTTLPMKDITPFITLPPHDSFMNSSAFNLYCRLKILTDSFIKIIIFFLSLVY